MGESKIIVVANQKGGVGKSTLCMLLASYLVNVEKMPIGGIIDTDYQQSIKKKREEDVNKLRGADEGECLPDPYKIASFPLDCETVPEFIRRLKSLDDTFIIDTPGILYNKGVTSFLALADFIICPFDYTRLSLQSTTEFLMYCNKLMEKLKEDTEYVVRTRIILVPNGKPVNVGTKLEKELWKEVCLSFAKLGYLIAPEIPAASAIRRCNTIEITEGQLSVAENTLSFISTTIFNH
ncbi:MAG: ParA family protein [Muribaculum sp.]|nr:ParA family protein [Muribaculum sp.]